MYLHPVAGADEMLDDSMLGGDGDVDVAALLSQINQQQPGLVSGSGLTGGSSGGQVTEVESPGIVSVFGGGVGANSAVLELLKRQTDAMEQLVKGKVDKDEAEVDGSGLKRRIEKVSYHPQDPVMFLETYNIEDDGHDKLDTRLRQRLRPINSDPKLYWKRGAFNRVDTPILGSTLYLEHLMPGTVNEATICKRHDSHAYVEIKNFLSKNSGVGTASKKQIKVHEVSDELFAMGVQQHWDTASSVWEVMDAGFNYMAVEYMIRPYSYSPLAMMRVLHESRYFCGVASDPKQQRTLLESFFNECMKKNQARAREGKHPVQYMEAMEIAQRVMAANKVPIMPCFVRHVCQSCHASWVMLRIMVVIICRHAAYIMHGHGHACVMLSFMQVMHACCVVNSCSVYTLSMIGY